MVILGPLKPSLVKTPPHRPAAAWTPSLVGSLVSGGARYPGALLFRPAGEGAELGLLEVPGLKDSYVSVCDPFWARPALPESIVLTLGISLSLSPS